MPPRLAALDDSAAKIGRNFESTKNFDEKKINEVRKGLEEGSKELRRNEERTRL